MPAGPTRRRPTISSLEQVIADGAERPFTPATPGPLGSPHPMVRMLPGGGPVAAGGYPSSAPPALLRTWYREMVVARRLDVEATALQRQGELALWTMSAGQEAAQVGSAHALAPGDHAFPSYREHAAALVLGVDPMELLSLFRGRDFGGWDTEARRFHLYTLVLATQLLHATGYARGIQLDRGRAAPGEAVIAYFGDGAASEGDASEALAWAAVDRVPLVFFCQNNQWAISTPSSRQTVVPVHRRAEGFGVPGVLVDGNDPLAVYAVTSAAMDRARAGGGPTLIEALTYRLGGHSTADDPTRYRPAAEVELWTARDPIPRLLAHLRTLGLADEQFLAETDRTADALADRVRREVPALPDPPADDLRRHVHPTDP